MQSSISMESERGQQTSTSVCKLNEKPEHKYLQDLPKQEKKIRETGIKNDPKPCQPDTPRGCSIGPLVNSSVASSVIPTTDNQPSSRMLKMKFQKSSTYFHLTKEERKENIWSLQHLSFDEKNTLLERTNFYATYFQKSKCLLNQNDKVTMADPGRLCKPGSENICLSSTDTGEMCNSSQKTHGDSSAYMEQQVRRHNLPQNITNGDQNSKVIPEISIHNLLSVCGAVEENVALPLERNTDNMEPEDINLCSPEPTTTCLTKTTEEDGHKITVEQQDETAMKNDTQIPFHPQTVNQTATSESRQDTEVRSNLNSVTEQKPQDALNANSDASRRNTEASSKLNSVTEGKSQDTVPIISEGSRQIRELRCEPILATEGEPSNALVVDTMANGKSSEPRCPVIYESHTDIMDSCEEVHDMEISEEVVSADVFPGVKSSQDHERLVQKNREGYGTGQDQEKESKTYSTCDGIADNTEECQADDSQAKDTVYSFLYNRLQLSELFLSPNQNGACSFPDKHYLKPKCKDRPTDTNKSILRSYNPNQVDRGEGCNLRITINADREYSAVTESPSLSKIFSVSECPPETQASPTVQENEKLTNNSNITENTPIDGVLKATTTYTTNNRAHARNDKLIKMMAEQYKGKENASVRKMRHYQHSRVKKRSIIEKPITDLPYSETSNSSYKAITGHMQMQFAQREKDHLNVPHKNRNFSPNKVRRNIRDRTLGNKHKSCSKLKSSKATAQNISVSDYSKTSK
ncbi:hypothetical protein J4Q44_G00237230, partial [Coregonus suidteri]